MALTEQDVFGEVSKGVVKVTPPGTSKAVFLASPPVGTWIELVQTLQALDGKTPDSATVVKTVASCMAAEDGAPLDDGSLKSLLAKSPPTTVMWLYKKCWDTVLKVDVREIGELEKN